MTVATATRPTSSSISSAQPAGTCYRITSIDIVRGIVMILMAIDHVRVFSGVPAGGPTPGVFFTRWITHFVAPAFVFLAGTAAFLHGTRLPKRSALARFLLARGGWLILLEMTVIRVSWTFNFDFSSYLLAGVIWVIGWCMILMAGLVFLPAVVTGCIGVAIIALHNLLPAPGPWIGQSSVPGLLQLLYYGDAIGPLAVLYTIVPWIGVMAAGYGFGLVMQRPAQARRTFCIRLGTVMIALFILLRAWDGYGDPRKWRPSPPAAQASAASQASSPEAAQANPPKRPAISTVMAFLNTSKYPASLLFLLMTLGPAILALGLFEGARGPATRVLATFGGVPLFYYLLHIPAIHVAALVVSVVRSGAVNPWLFTNHPMWPPEVPAGYTWSLPLLYLVTMVVVALLYFPCRWFGRLRARRRDLHWLSYL